MKPFYCVVMVLSALLLARASSAEDVIIRLVDVNSGGGERNCYVALFFGDPRTGPGHTNVVRTSADGRAHFSLREPLPKTVWANVEAPDDCAWPCAYVGVLPIDDILRTGFMMKLPGDVNTKGVSYCTPNYGKLQKITAKPGEILVFVRRPSWLEKLSRR
jgi:hypothetical protein